VSADTIARTKYFEVAFWHKMSFKTHHRFRHCIFEFNFRGRNFRNLPAFRSYRNER